MRRRNMKRVAAVVAVAAAALALSGCASSTIQSRKQERYAAYAELPTTMKDAVDHGEIQVGMPMDAVYIAWGPPDQTANSGGPEGELTTWLYYGGYMATTTYFGWHHTYYGSTPINYTRAMVDFGDGKVKTWRTYPTPPY